MHLKVAFFSPGGLEPLSQALHSHYSRSHWMELL